MYACTCVRRVRERESVPTFACRRAFYEARSFILQVKFALIAVPPFLAMMKKNVAAAAVPTHTYSLPLSHTQMRNTHM